MARLRSRHDFYVQEMPTPFMAKKYTKKGHAGQYGFKDQDVRLRPRHDFSSSRLWLRYFKTIDF